MKKAFLIACAIGAVLGSIFVCVLTMYLMQ
jgi:Mg/Co/Ni transporter MgtE